MWREIAHTHEALADRYARDGGPLTEWYQLRDGLRTYHELVLYAWIKYYEASHA